MCGAWRLGSGGRSGGGGLECDTAEGQDQAQEQAWPHYYHTTTLQPLQSAAAPQMGHRPHTAPSPQSSWRGHTRHRMTASPGPGPGLCQVQSLGRVRGLSGVRSEAWWDYTAVSHSRERGPGLVQTTECRSETGLGLNTTLTLVTTQSQAQEIRTVTAVTSQQRMKGFHWLTKNWKRVKR